MAPPTHRPPPPPPGDFNSLLRGLITALSVHAPFTRGGRRQAKTRGMDGRFLQDGVRCAPSGSTSAQQGWHPGHAEWYHNRGKRALQEAWRACRAPLATLLFSFLSQSVGPVLTAFQTAVMDQPGLQEVRLQPDVPYQMLQASVNAEVRCHLDKLDVLGTCIMWLAFPAAGAQEQEMLGGAFMLYCWGAKLHTSHMAHVWVRSDRCWHGTVRDEAQALIRDGALLFGVALTNSALVTHDVLRAFRVGGVKTWLQRYDGELQHTVVVQK